MSSAANKLFDRVGFLENENQELRAQMVAMEEENKSLRVQLEEWSMRYDTEEGRQAGELQFRQMFPNVDVRHEEKPGVFLLVAQVSAKMHGRIKTEFGGC